MEWIIIKDGEELCEANCQYDSLDLSVMMYEAKEVLIDFENKVAKIIR